MKTAVLKNEKDAASVFPEDVLNEALFVEWAPGEDLFLQEAPAGYLMYLVRGRVKTHRDYADGHSSLLNFSTAPCYLGEIEFLTGEPCSATVTAIGSCRCIAVPMRLRERMLADNGFVRALGVYLCGKLRRAERRSSGLVCFTLACRLADFILTSSHGGVYREPRQEAAEHLGVTYRHLLYVLSDFLEKGYLKKEGKAFQITDRAALERLAEPIRGEEHAE